MGHEISGSAILNYRRFFLRSWVLIPMIVGLHLPLSAFAEAGVEPVITKEVEITAPMPEQVNDVGVEKEKMPSNVQTVTGKQMREKQATTLTEVMNSSMQSVNVNEFQGNALQADVNFRGFTASPLLGTPQGLSIYLDGVRVNEAFGDVVNWDLIPMMAISRMDLVPGSNPVFGLNTLGGAIALRTRDGFSDPGTTMEVTGGSWGRQQYQLATGVNNGTLGGFMALNFFDEDGWRDFAPSKVKQGFGRVDFKSGNWEASASLLLGDTDMTGNGLTPKHLLAERWSSVMTAPDETQNQLQHLNLNATYWLGENSNITGQMYVRHQDRQTFNGDVNDSDSFQGAGTIWNGRNWASGSYQILGPDCQSLSLAGADDMTNPAAVCQDVNAYNTVLGLDPDFVRNVILAGGSAPVAMIHYSDTTQKSKGSSLRYNVVSGRHNLTVGMSLDYSKMRFLQSEQFAVLDANRIVEARQPTSIFDPYYVNSSKVLVNDLQGDSIARGYYISDVWEPMKSLNVTTALRYSDTSVSTRMTHYEWRLGRDTPVSSAPNGVVSGDSQTFRQVAPALGLTWEANPGLTVYGGVSRGMRAPSPIELGCAVPQGADAHDPDKNLGCSVQTVLTNDPPLKAVISRSYEIGLRGMAGKHWSWNATAFRTDLHNDIIFLLQTPSFLTQFTNIPETRREGIELGLEGHYDKVSLNASYGLTLATYQSSFETGNGANSSNVGRGAAARFTVNPGDRMPSVPLNTLKLNLDWAMTPDFSLGANVLAQSFVYLRGNENNAHQVLYGSNPNTTYVDPGIASGFAILNMNARWNMDRHWSVALKINNVFDRRYYTAGELRSDPFSPSVSGFVGANGFNYNSNDWRNVANLAPGAPRAAWLTISYDFDGRGKQSGRGRGDSD